MKSFHVKIVTPKGIYRTDEIELLNVRTTMGQIGILANHMPLASAIEISEMNIVKNGNREEFAIAGGFIYVNVDETTIIANAIESQSEIDLDRAKDAKKRAEERIQHRNDVDIARAEAALKRAIVRIRVKDL